MNSVDMIGPLRSTLRPKWTKFDFWLGQSPDPAGRAYASWIWGS